MVRRNGFEVRSSHCGLHRHVAKLGGQPPALSSCQRDLIVSVVHRSSAMRHVKRTLNHSTKSSKDIQNVPARQRVGRCAVKLAVTWQGGAWAVSRGRFAALVGPSSRNVSLHCEFEVVS